MMRDLDEDELKLYVVDDGSCEHLITARMAAEIRRHRSAIKAFVETVEAAARANERRGKGGQQVSFHGDFCAATPSVLDRLEWWARHLRGE